MKAAVLLVLIGITIAAAAPIRYPHHSAGSWMADLEDHRNIRTLSIPGTHDSGTPYSFAGLFGNGWTGQFALSFFIWV